MLVIMAVLQHKTKFYSRLKGAMIYRVTSLFLLVGGTIEFSLSIQWNPDPFLILIAGAHLISFIAIMIIVLLVGYDDIIKGILFGGTFVAIHELIWTGFFFIAGTPLIGAVPLEVILVYYGAYVALLLCVIFAFVSFFGVSALKVYSRVTAVILVFDIVWLALGFKATVSLMGQTIYRVDPTINAVECLGWAIPAAWLIIEYLIEKRRSKSYDMVQSLL